MIFTRDDMSLLLTLDHVTSTQFAKSREWVPSKSSGSLANLDADGYYVDLDPRFLVFLMFYYDLH